MDEDSTDDGRRRGRVLVAMSGGVDSSVTALLLRDAGYECVGATMRLFDNDEGIPARNAGCCRLADVEDARCVAWALGIPHQVIDLREEFREMVIGRFVDDYERGLTPNPCICCNRLLKFGILYDVARERGCDFIATGHYARIVSEEGLFRLRCGIDPEKDQSYVLYMLSQDQLAHTLLPLGGLDKSETRRIAEEHGLVNASKHDSQDICFVPDGDYAGFLERSGASGLEPGDFVDSAGSVLGRHRGIARYTVGQRKGLGIASTGRIYVTHIDAGQNEVGVGSREELRVSSFEATDVRWTSPDPPARPFVARSQTHYHGALCDVMVTPLPEGRVRIEPLAPLYAVAPGQAVVLYRGDEVLGGGTITTVTNSRPDAQPGI